MTRSSCACAAALGRCSASSLQCTKQPSTRPTADVRLEGRLPPAGPPRASQPPPHGPARRPPRSPPPASAPPRGTPAPARHGPIRLLDGSRYCLESRAQGRGARRCPCSGQHGAQSSAAAGKGRGRTSKAAAAARAKGSTAASISAAAPSTASARNCGRGAQHAQHGLRLPHAARSATTPAPPPVGHAPTARSASGAGMRSGPGPASTAAASHNARWSP
jgi:hypothetical protein